MGSLEKFYPLGSSLEVKYMRDSTSYTTYICRPQLKQFSNQCLTVERTTGWPNHFLKTFTNWWFSLRDVSVNYWTTGKAWRHRVRSKQQWRQARKKSETYWSLKCSIYFVFSTNRTMRFYVFSSIQYESVTILDACRRQITRFVFILPLIKCLRNDPNILSPTYNKTIPLCLH